jgi:UDP-N-acetylglucosamine acyltransferase
MAQIHPTALVDSGAVIADDATVGPYCVIGPNVTLASGVRLVSQVSISGHTTVGERTVIYPFASLGTPPQSTKYKGGPTRLVVGADCDIREGVTMNTGTEEDGGLTQVGDRCFFMVNSHVAHDCRIGNGVTFANGVLLGGHSVIGDNVTFGGGAAVRQFVRIGEGAMIVGLSGIRADVIPFGMAHGPLADLVGLNVVGMRRRGHSKADIHRLRAAYQAVFFGAGTFRERVEQVAAENAGHALVDGMIAFIREAKRPLTMAVHRAETSEAS